MATTGDVWGIFIFVSASRVYCVSYGNYRRYGGSRCMRRYWGNRGYRSCRPSGPFLGGTFYFLVAYPLVLSCHQSRRTGRCYPHGGGRHECTRRLRGISCGRPPVASRVHGKRRRRGRGTYSCRDSYSGGYERCAGPYLYALCVFKDMNVHLDFGHLFDKRVICRTMYPPCRRNSEGRCRGYGGWRNGSPFYVFVVCPHSPVFGRVARTMGGVSWVGTPRE